MAWQWNSETGEGKKLWTSHNGSFENNISGSLITSLLERDFTYHLLKELGELGERGGWGVGWSGAVVKIRCQGPPCLVSNPPYSPALQADSQPGRSRILHWGRKHGSLLPIKHVGRGSILACHPTCTVSWPPNSSDHATAWTLLSSFSRGGNRGQRVVSSTPPVSGNLELESSLPAPLVLVQF